MPTYSQKLWGSTLIVFLILQLLTIGVITGLIRQSSTVSLKKDFSKHYQVRNDGLFETLYDTTYSSLYMLDDHNNKVEITNYDGNGDYVDTHFLDTGNYTNFRFVGQSTRQFSIVGFPDERTSNSSRSVHLIRIDKVSFESRSYNITFPTQSMFSFFGLVHMPSDDVIIVNFDYLIDNTENITITGTSIQYYRIHTSGTITGSNHLTFDLEEAQYLKNIDVYNNKLWVTTSHSTISNSPKDNSTRVTHDIYHYLLDVTNQNKQNASFDQYRSYSGEDTLDYRFSSPDNYFIYDNNRERIQISYQDTSVSWNISYSFLDIRDQIPTNNYLFVYGHYVEYDENSEFYRDQGLLLIAYPFLGGIDIHEMNILQIYENSTLIRYMEAYEKADGTNILLFEIYDEGTGESIYVIGLFTGKVIEDLLHTFFPFNFIIPFLLSIITYPIIQKRLRKRSDDLYLNYEE